MLSRNTFLDDRILQDLNVDPQIPASVCGTLGENGLLDASTCVVSIDYLIKPLDVLSSLLQRTRVGGTVHLAVSNRCFPTSEYAYGWHQRTERLLTKSRGTADYLLQRS